jgi:hypothetical protein
VTWPEERLAPAAEGGDAWSVEPEWEDATLIMEVLLDVRDGVQRVLDLLEENGEEEAEADR